MNQAFELTALRYGGLPEPAPLPEITVPAPTMPPAAVLAPTLPNAIVTLPPAPAILAPPLPCAYAVFNTTIETPDAPASTIPAHDPLTGFNWGPTNPGFCVDLASSTAGMRAAVVQVIARNVAFYRGYKSIIAGALSVGAIVGIIAYGIEIARLNA